MHCPKCGFEIESDEVSFCSRCGLTLTNVRAAMAADTAAMPTQRRGGAINVGVVLMFLATLPTMAAVLTSPIAIPAALLMLLLGYAIVLFGSGPLLRAFKPADEALASEPAAREFRRELAFGATLMFFGVLVASFFIPLMPRQLENLGIIGFPILMFAFLLLSSGWIFDSIQDLTGAERLPGTGAAGIKRDTTEASRRHKSPDLLNVPASASTADLEPPPSVVENTTRHLSKRAGSQD
jgi:predicted nucleic acid-binding Zn ribbon protein